MTVADLDDRMSAGEYATWQRVYASDPWGEVRADLRIGHQTASIASMLSRKGAKIKVSDFVLQMRADKPRRPRRAAKEIESMFRRQTEALGGKIIG